jgi:L-ascorbate metabolism protein UlaG (beta-lactamase superfamily)
VNITFISHAALLIEAEGLRILSDPWWQGPCFGNQWWLYPRPFLECLNGKPVDYIFISHGHSDHFHRGTLRRFPRRTKVIVSQGLELALALREMDFEVIQLDRDEVRDLGNCVTCQIMPTCGGDSLMILKDHSEVCVNANDSLHAAPTSLQDQVTARIKALYPRIDYLFCAYGIASHFPNCYIIPGKDYLRTAENRQRYFNRQWARIVGLLEPRFAFPFAADVVFLDPDLFWTNEPVRNSERPTSAFIFLYPNSATKVVDIGSGFAVADGMIVRDVRFNSIGAAEVRSAYADVISKNKIQSERRTDGADLLKEALEQNIAVCRSYLFEYSGGYRFLLLLRDRTWALQIVKQGTEIRLGLVDADTVQRADYDVILTSTFAYLRRSLTHEYGNEILFVGSGCLIEYTDRQQIKENVHDELMTMVAKRRYPPKLRFGDQPKWLFQLKSIVKAALGRREVDLYDLQAWTLFEGEAAGIVAGGAAPTEKVDLDRRVGGDVHESQLRRSG